MLINSKKLVMPMLLIIGLILGCGLTDQTDEANKLVTEANKMIMEDNQKTVAANLLFDQLLGSGLSSVENVESYKKENKTKFDELSAKFGELEKNEPVIIDKFRQASQLKLNEKYKQYLELKVQEFSKQSEATKLINPLINSFLETKDIDKINSLLDDYNAKRDAIAKETEAFQKQADQIASDNPTLIK